MRCSKELQRLCRSAASAASRGWQATTARAYSTETSSPSDAPSSSGKDGDAPIFAACVLQRLPLVRAPTPESQAQHLIKTRERALETGELKDYPEVAVGSRAEAGGKAQQQDLRAFTPVPTTTAADASGDISTMRRRLTESLYLVVRGKGKGGGSGSSGDASSAWTFPSAANSGEESISETAQRALSSAIGRAHPVFFVGNAPMAHLRVLPQGKTFFMLAQAVDDPWDLKLPEGGPAQEHAWLTKSELVGGVYLSDARMRELLSKML